MKLIRLVTEDENSIFDNTFNDSLTLKPNSKIALQSLSIETENNVIEIDGSNDTITFGVQLSFQKTITLDRGTYNKSNFKDLLTDIQVKLNEATGFNVLADPDPFPVRRNLGLQWKVEVNSKNKISIGYQIGTWGEYETYWDYNTAKVLRLTLSNGRTLYRLANEESDFTIDNDRSMLLPYYVSTGCSVVRCRTNRFTEDSYPTFQGGYIIALSRTDLSNKKPDEIVDSDISYGIHVTTTSPNTVKRYYVIVDGVHSLAGGVLPNYEGNGDIRNDFQEIMINFDRVELNIYQNATGDLKNQIANFPYLAGEKLYPLFILRGKNVDFNMVRTLVSPYTFDPPINNSDVQLVGAPPIPIRLPSENFLEMTIGLSNFLGYDNPRYPRTGTIRVLEFDWIAENVFEPSEIADAFLIELLNLKCESYDGFLNQRKNILAVIPKSNVNGEVIYETNTPFFIDLNNANEILLRNIRCRVVRPDYSVLPMRGLASMVLLIDSA